MRAADIKQSIDVPARRRLPATVTSTEYRGLARLCHDAGMRVAGLPPLEAYINRMQAYIGHRPG
jgi:hypothetical protein